MLAEIVAKSQQMYFMTVSKTTVFSHLDMLIYTLKSIRYDPERAKTPENKEKCKVFVQKLLDYQGQNRPIVLMDETNFSIHISRSVVRSVRGTHCTVAAVGSKGANVHVIVCISTFGLTHFEVKRGAFH